MVRGHGVVAGLLLLLIMFCGLSHAAEPGEVILKNQRVALGVTTAGGGIIEFRLAGEAVNPLNWTIHGLEPVQPGKPYLRGHFLCLDRWGAPSEAEAERGVPFHGEAPRINWKLSRAPKPGQEFPHLRMECRMPLAGLSVVRTIRLSRSASVARVHEKVTNNRNLGRIYNMVQHPSIAAPFLDETTLIDTNATFGFLQEGEIPASSERASLWPRQKVQGQRVDLRRFLNNETRGVVHDVSSFIFDSETEFGWVTAVNPKTGLLLGYTWQTRDYPWLNIWRHRENGRVKSRGLEFGTTGLHQPFGTLVAQGRILERPVFTYIDAGGSVSREYLMFTIRVPENYAGVNRLMVDSKAGSIELFERPPGKRRLSLSLDLAADSPGM
ncbi:MAG TPA: hypothetical protein DCE43_06150 [Planctomycetaceae bacterium]|mgnify:FL=1|nr:hypothetical protein [Planctomycetaceae bacterium]HCK53266.1 hypothetical protein [Planctomycetaceae bacterium]|tara:strand:- start:254 stop:1399 length:1146 start_codon:yes stop_codon:yes gene_type:complete